jgi:hypothetical protein
MFSRSAPRASARCSLSTQLLGRKLMIAVRISSRRPRLRPWCGHHEPRSSRPHSIVSPMGAGEQTASTVLSVSSVGSSTGEATKSALLHAGVSEVGARCHRHQDYPPRTRLSIQRNLALQRCRWKMSHRRVSVSDRNQQRTCQQANASTILARGQVDVPALGDSRALTTRSG